MKFSIFILLFLSAPFAAFPQEESEKPEKPKKNIIGVDLNFIDGSSYSLFGMNFNGRYIRDLHRFLDVSTSIGYVLSYTHGSTNDDVGFGAGDHFLKYYPVVACFKPLKKETKVLQLGTGLSMYKIRNFKPDMGMTFQLNYLKKKQKKFVWGFNVYVDVMFSRPYKVYKQLAYGGGLGFFLGGRF